MKNLEVCKGCDIYKARIPIDNRSQSKHWRFDPVSGLLSESEMIRFRDKEFSVKYCPCAYCDYELEHLMSESKTPC